MNSMYGPAFTCRGTFWSSQVKSRTSLTYVKRVRTAKGKYTIAIVELSLPGKTAPCPPRRKRRW